MVKKRKFSEKELMIGSIYFNEKKRIETLFSVFGEEKINHLLGHLNENLWDLSKDDLVKIIIGKHNNLEYR